MELQRKVSDQQRRGATGHVVVRRGPAAAVEQAQYVQPIGMVRLRSTGALDHGVEIRIERAFPPAGLNHLARSASTSSAAVVCRMSWLVQHRIEGHLANDFWMVLLVHVPSDLESRTTSPLVSRRRTGRPRASQVVPRRRSAPASTAGRSCRRGVEPPARTCLALVVATITHIDDGIKVARRVSSCRCRASRDLLVWARLIRVRPVRQGRRADIRWTVGPHRPAALSCIRPPVWVPLGSAGTTMRRIVLTRRLPTSKPSSETGLRGRQFSRPVVEHSGRRGDEERRHGDE